MRPRTAALLCLVLLALPAAAGEPVPASGVELRSSDDKILYALGLSLAEQIGDFEVTPAELALVEAGLRDGASGAQTAISLVQWAPRVESFLARRREATALRERDRAREYLASAAREPGAVRRASGLIYRELRAGSGESPTAASRVKVNYEGRRVDGSIFDSSAERGQASQFALGSVIKCWTEGVQLMKPGGKARLVCPPELAYGQKGMPGKIKPGSTLDFEIELLEVLPPAPAPAAKQGS
jgi:FKBP-type peptidyl-prolyl cis-trans isomerase FkpA